MNILLQHKFVPHQNTFYISCRHYFTLNSNREVNLLEPLKTIRFTGTVGCHNCSVEYGVQTAYQD